jgi:hypothetical protein
LQIKLGSKYFEKILKLEIFKIEGITFGTTPKVPSNLLLIKKISETKGSFQIRKLDKTGMQLGSF